MLGCGTLGGPPASDRVPNAGVTGWHLLPAVPGTSIQEPFVFCPQEGVSHPAVVHQGPIWRMWLLTPDGNVRAASATDGLHDWTDDGPVDLPGGPWVDISVAELDGDWRVAASSATGNLIRIFSSADASNWSASGSLAASAAWTAGEIGGPALLGDRAMGGWRLFHAGARGSAIGIASSPDGSIWTEADEPLFTTASIQSETGWSVLAIGAPAAGLDVSRPDRPVYKLWFEASELRHLPTPSADELVEVIGFAGSFDAEQWIVWSGNPVFQQRMITVPGAPTVFVPTREPSVVADGYTYRMFFDSPFALDGGPVRPCIAVALDP